MPRKKKLQDATAYNKAFPTRLRKLMEEKEMTQYQLADRLGKTRQAVSNYCDGSSSPPWETIAEIAKAFDCSADYLLGLSEYKKPETAARTLESFGISEDVVDSLESTIKDFSPRDLMLQGLNTVMSQDAFYSTCRSIGALSNQVDHIFDNQIHYDQLKAEKAEWDNGSSDKIILRGRALIDFRISEILDQFRFVIGNAVGLIKLQLTPHETIELLSLDVEHFMVAKRYGAKLIEPGNYIPSDEQSSNDE